MNTMHSQGCACTPCLIHRTATEVIREVVNPVKHERDRLQAANKEMEAREVRRDAIIARLKEELQQAETRPIDGVHIREQQRIGVEQREEARMRLTQAHGDGCLTEAEFNARNLGITKAEVQPELNMLVSDLPALISPGRAPVGFEQHSKICDELASAERHLRQFRRSSGYLVTVLIVLTTMLCLYAVGVLHS